MHTGDALIKSIIAHHNDDTPRLIYADWLEENDQPAQAAFIRRQIDRQDDEHEVLWRQTGTNGDPMVFKRLLALEPWHNAPESFHNAGHAWIRSNTTAILWRRGFIEGILCTIPLIKQNLSTLRRHPVRVALILAYVRQYRHQVSRWVKKLHPDWSEGGSLRDLLKGKDDCALSCLCYANFANAMLNPMRRIGAPISPFRNWESMYLTAEIFNLRQRV